jgi:putative transposase
LGSQAVQDVVQRLQKAYERFFNKQGGFPRFKKVKKYPSFMLKQKAGWKLLEEYNPRGTDKNRRHTRKIRILGRSYKFCQSRPIEGEIKTVTVKRDRLGRLWVCFSVVMKVEQPEFSTGKSGGFDFGLKHFLTNDEGEVIESPQFFAQARYQIARLNKELSRKQDGSHNRKRAKYRLAKAHNDVKNKRRDWFYKLAHALCDHYGVMYFEDLNLNGMKRLWGRKVSDLAFGEFVLILQHVASKRGVRVHKIDRWEPTSQVCSDCGQKKKLDLRDRVFVCDCGLSIDRDHNAAINVLRVGASTHSLEVVRREEGDSPDSRSLVRS